MNKKNDYLNHTYNNSLDINKILRNTYLLLSLTILFSACTSFLSMILDFHGINFAFFFLLLIIFSSIINHFRNTILALPLVFIFTGFIGYNSGNIINSILNTNSGTYVICHSLFSTGLLFFSLSFYTLISKKDFSFLNNFIFIMIVITIIGFISLYLFNMQLLNILFSLCLMTLSSASILYTTSSMIREKHNYILITVSLYLSIYNMFFSFLILFKAYND